MRTRLYYYIFVLFYFCVLPLGCLKAQNKEVYPELISLQQKFVDLKFGMFIHFNIPTYMADDWADPDASVTLFNPKKLDCKQWAKAAKSANMKYGCLTTKHHSGFCIWDTKTTDYGVMNSPLKRDVVKEYVDAFRDEGLQVMLYYSILDTHHKLRPGFISKSHIDMIKAQLTELLTNYGEITAFIIDGWDAPWSRISYEEVPFEDIYRLVKRLQPNCLVMDLNAAKYPAGALFYTDIKSYEQNAGQHISKENNLLPALSCLPINKSWFWKESFPVSSVKDPLVLVKDNLEPFNNAYCNFILNVAPNRDGLIDENVLNALSKIGKIWKDNNIHLPLPRFDAPVISENIAKHQPVNSSWSDDMWIMDFGNDDDFSTFWKSNNSVKEPWYEVCFDRTRPFNMITIADINLSIKKFRLLYESNGKWNELAIEMNGEKIKTHRFDRVWGEKVKIIIEESSGKSSIAEFGVYDEQR